jgi:hypothetical protein
MERVRGGGGGDMSIPARAVWHEGNPRRGRISAAGRVCSSHECGTVLSIYNRGDSCWQHQPVGPYVMRFGRPSRADEALRRPRAARMGGQIG